MSRLKEFWRAEVGWKLQGVLTMFIRNCDNLDEGGVQYETTSLMGWISWLMKYYQLIYLREEWITQNKFIFIDITVFILLKDTLTCFWNLFVGSFFINLLLPELTKTSYKYTLLSIYFHYSISLSSFVKIKFNSDIFRRITSKLCGYVLWNLIS